jgi:hypothetical protein
MSFSFRLSARNCFGNLPQLNFVNAKKPIANIVISLVSSDFPSDALENLLFLKEI